MEEKVIERLSKTIVEKFSNKIDIKEEMDIFLNTSLSIEKKEEALELLYICQLYYCGCFCKDPRGMASILLSMKSILGVKDDKSFECEIEDLKRNAEFLKQEATHPVDSMRSIIEFEERREIF